MDAPPDKTVFLDYDTVSCGDLDLGRLRAAAGDLVLYDSSETQIAERIRDADVVLLNKLELTRALLCKAPRLKLIALAATGTNNVDLCAARERGIAVCNVRAYCTASVVQHVWGLILSLTQHVDEFSRLVQGRVLGEARGRRGLSYPIRELQGRIFGVVGWGDLGQRRGTHRRGLRHARYDRQSAGEVRLKPGRVPLDELLATADILSLHCPLNAATRGLIGARELALMKPDALLINTARGALGRRRGACRRSEAGRLGGAGIDVLAQEPPRAGRTALGRAEFPIFW